MFPLQSQGMVLADTGMEPSLGSSRWKWPRGAAGISDPGMSHPARGCHTLRNSSGGRGQEQRVEQSQLVPFGKSFSIWKFLTLSERKQQQPQKKKKKKRCWRFPKIQSWINSKGQIPVPVPSTTPGLARDFLGFIPAKSGPNSGPGSFYSINFPFWNYFLPKVRRV